MRPLELNLASRPFRNNGLLWVGHGLLAVAVVAFTAWNTVTFVDTGRDLEALRNTVGSVDSRVREVERRERDAEARIAKHDLKYLTTQTFRANEVIQRRAFSWTRLFNQLEKVQPYEIKMVSIHPIFGSQGGLGPATAGPAKPEVVPVTVEGTAKTIRDFFELEDALIADPHFDRIEPSRSTHAKNGEVLFGLSFLYFPDGSREKPLADLADREGSTEEELAEAAEPAPPPADEEAAPAPVAAVQPPQPRPQPDPAAPPAAEAEDRPRATEATEIAPPRPAFRAPERRPPPEGPVRKKPEGWQPPDPFADRKKKEEKR